MNWIAKITLVLLSISLFNCSNKKIDNKNLSFPDSLFVLKNLKSFSGEFKFDTKWDGHGLRVSFKGRPVIALDSAQKVMLLKPFSNHLTMYSDQPWLYNSNFIAKLEKIRDLQPIIISVGGTDYSTVWYIVLDKENTPRSCYILEGENCESFGEDFELTDRDSAVTLCSKKKNYFKGNTIESQKLTVTRLYNKEFEIVDSVSYLTTIKDDGSLATERLDSNRLQRKARYFNRYRSD